MLALEMTRADFICRLDKFTINRQVADADDFGIVEDTNPACAPYEGGCGNGQFIPDRVSQKVLELYDISIDDYYTICSELEKILSFGCCDLCG